MNCEKVRFMEEQTVEVAKEFHRLCETGKAEDGNPYSKR